MLETVHVAAAGPAAVGAAVGDALGVVVTVVGAGAAVVGAGAADGDELTAGAGADEVSVRTTSSTSKLCLVGSFGPQTLKSRPLPDAFAVYDKSSRCQDVSPR
jgi:hypothetical protein